MKTFFITDTHFFHANIIKYCNRPHNHDSLMIDNWNRIVSKDDLVIHLGDFTLKRQIETVKGLVSALNGNIILIKGNHDHLTDDQYREAGFIHVCDGMVLNRIYFSHIPVAQLPSGSIYNVHGHFHNNARENWDFKTYDFSRLLYIEDPFVNYSPITMDQMCNHLNIRQYSL